MSKQDAVQFAESLRKRVAGREYPYNEHKLHVGLSVGVATAPDDAKTSEELFHAADQAMYRAKRGGKNRVAT
jgi:diguanylate cyclase (GGDEF)-like protein